MKYEYRSIDLLLRQVPDAATPDTRHHLLPNITFRKQGAFDFKLRPELFLGDDKFNAGVVERVHHAASMSRGLPVGILEFRDVHVHLPTGRIIDHENRCCWYGWLINWAVSEFRAGIVQEPGEDGDTLDLPDDCGTMASAILIAGGGFGIYGHWLLDYLPRLNRLSGEDFRSHRVIKRPSRKWAAALAGIFSPGCNFSDASDALLVRVERLLVPTSARAHQALEENSVRMTWNRLGYLLARDPSAPAHGTTPRKIFVSRQKFAKGMIESRVIENIGLVERQALKAGFVTVHPETLSFAEQRVLFAGADVILGEDGSGLHNAIYSQPGARLGVISNERMNALHAMIANTRDMQILYIPTARTQDGGEAGGARLHKRDFDRAIDQLVS